MEEVRAIKYSKIKAPSNTVSYIQKVYRHPSQTNRFATSCHQLVQLKQSSRPITFCWGAAPLISSVLKSEHREELLFNHSAWFRFRMDPFRCPQGDSNPCLSLERAPSWATRRWGRLFIGRARLYHPTYQSSTSVLAVPWTRKTCTSPGPCTPIVCDISMSPVREGPVMKTADLDSRRMGSVIASARDGRILDEHNTAIWISGRSDACIGLPSPSAIKIDPLSASPEIAFVTPARNVASGAWLTTIPTARKTDASNTSGSRWI